MQLVVMGASAGGIRLFSSILPHFPADYPRPIAIAHHIPDNMPEDYVDRLNTKTALEVVEAKHFQKITPGKIYFAPAGYHLLVESKNYFALSVDHRVNFARPSIDVLFESAAEAFCQDLRGVIMSGANADGVAGAKAIIHNGGLMLVQDPRVAEVSQMPRAVLAEIRSNRLLVCDDEQLLTELGVKNA